MTSLFGRLSDLMNHNSAIMNGYSRHEAPFEMDAALNGYIVYRAPGPWYRRNCARIPLRAKEKKSLETSRRIHDTAQYGTH